jgi:signal transduction histidine kinase
VGTELHVSASFPGTAIQRYSAALAATLAALLLSGALTPFAGAAFPYLALFSALVFSALFCGVGPSAVGTLVAILGMRYWFATPVRSFSMPDAPQFLSFLAFLLLSGIVVAMGEIHRRRGEALRKTHLDLEARVRERTAELATANEELGDLTARLLHLQDEERRRIARELHDSVGQSLAALNMNLSSLAADLKRLAKATSTVSDSAVLVNDMTKDIRTISYLLHPPLLDEAGLASALRMYIQGFTERSKIAVELQFPDHFDRLPRDLETTIFRLVQESLTNIHRHSEVLPLRSVSRAWRTKCESKSRIRGKAFHRKRHRNFFRTVPQGWESAGCAKDSANRAAVSRLVLRGTEGVPSSWPECRS